MIYRLARNLIQTSGIKSPTGNVNIAQKRNFFEWLVKIWNLVDEDRIKILGPERVTSEWLIRNGAAVRFEGEKSYFFDYHGFEDYNDPDNPPPMFRKKIVEIHAHESSIHHHGFKHFEYCKHIKKINFEFCHYLKDEAMEQLKVLKDSLEHLEIKTCTNVSDIGIRHLVNLSNLTTLVIHNLPSVENKEETEKVLKNGLRNCNITYEP